MKRFNIAPSHLKIAMAWDMAEATVGPYFEARKKVYKEAGANKVPFNEIAVRIATEVAWQEKVAVCGPPCWVVGDIDVSDGRLVDRGDHFLLDLTTFAPTGSRSRTRPRTCCATARVRATSQASLTTRRTTGRSPSR